MIGHSFGGLTTQLLLDRGLGAAGVAMDPAPPKGVMAIKPTVLKSLSGVLFTWRGWRKIVTWSFEEFRYAFMHSLPEQAQREAYENHVVPETGRIFFQAALAPVVPSSPLTINVKHEKRAPLLIIAGKDDKIAPQSVVLSTYKKYGRSSARTDYREFEGRTHWILAQDGWEEVAGAIQEWLNKL